VATITAAGTYALSGALTDGQVVVDTEDEQVVTLVLERCRHQQFDHGADCHPQCREVVIVLADNSANNVTRRVRPSSQRGRGRTERGHLQQRRSGHYGSRADRDQPNYNDAISSDDALTIAGSVITVNAVDDGLRGKDSLLIQGARSPWRPRGDGLKADKEDDATLLVAIEGGS
jgi:hypothetical protein